MTTTARENSEAAIWERVIHPHGKMTVTAARQIVQLEFTVEERPGCMNWRRKINRGR